MDGQKQRNALTAAERSLRALGGGDPDSARRAVARAMELDQIGIYSALGPAVEAGALDLDRGGVVSEASWEAIADALGPGPLAATVDSMRGT